MAGGSGKRLMVLGAGHEHVPLIRRAGELGHFAITVDNVPDNVGHRHSALRVEASTVDADAVLAAAERLAIDGILTIASDVAVPAVARVAERLGLPGPAPATARIMTDKAEFRRLQERAGLHGPEHVAGADLAALLDRALALEPPVLCKPVDTSGSRGITRIDDPTPERLAVAFAHARAFSRSGRVCVERFVEGLDVSGDGFVRDGAVDFLVVTRKHSRGAVPTGHRIPAGLAQADEARLRGEVAATCVAAGYRDGPFDFDARISPGAATLIEMSPRLGGNSIPVLIGRATGCDMLAATIAFALGEPLELPAHPHVRRACAVLVFGSEVAGRIVAMADEARVRAAVPEVFGLTLRRGVGDVAEVFEHSGRSLGWAVFDCPSPEDYAPTAERIRDALGLAVAAAGEGRT